MEQYRYNGNLFEISYHSPSGTLLSELKHVFCVSLNTSAIIIIPTFQQASLELVNIGNDVEKEKNRLLDSFVSFCKTLHNRFEARGYWFNYVDPCSGLPMICDDGVSGKLYDEVDNCQRLLKCKTLQAGSCRVLVHNNWGTRVYPATMFALAPIEEVKQIFEEFR